MAFVTFKDGHCECLTLENVLLDRKILLKVSFFQVWPH